MPGVHQKDRGLWGQECLAKKISFWQIRRYKDTPVLGTHTILKVFKFYTGTAFVIH